MEPPAPNWSKPSQEATIKTSRKDRRTAAPIRCKARSVEPYFCFQRNLCKSLNLQRSHVNEPMFYQSNTQASSTSPTSCLSSHPPVRLSMSPHPSEPTHQPHSFLPCLPSLRVASRHRWWRRSPGSPRPSRHRRPDGSPRSNSLAAPRGRSVRRSDRGPRSGRRSVRRGERHRCLGTKRVVLRKRMDINGRSMRRMVS